MNIEVSTINLLLGLIVTLQAWIIKELIALKIRVGVLSAECPRCIKKDVPANE